MTSIWMSESGYSNLKAGNDEEEEDPVPVVSGSQHSRVKSGGVDFLLSKYQVYMQVLREDYVGLYEEKIEERKRVLSLTSKSHPDSGFDLFVTEDVTIPAGEIKVINMQVKCSVYGNMQGGTKVPLPYYLYARSSVIKRGIILANSVGIIDCGYRGPLMTGFYNTRKEDVEIKAGERVAQICMCDLWPYFNVTLTQSIDQTERNEGGIGSTGL